jgi:hypothetical protein
MISLPAAVGSLISRDIAQETHKNWLIRTNLWQAGDDLPFKHTGF